MHKKGYSVFGKIDFFSVLQFIVVSLGNSLDLDWVLLSPELSKVGILFTINGHCSNFHTTISTLFQAIRSCQLDINGLPVLCQELLRHWSKVVAFLSKNSPPSRRYWSSQTREYTLALQTQGPLQYSNELLISSLRVWSGS